MNNKSDAAAFDVVISSIQQEAYGVCQRDGRIVYVRDALPDERVRIQIERTAKGISYANVVERMTTSEQRATPPCTVFGVCGGCVWQHASYTAQLTWKRDHVVHVLQRIGGLDRASILVHETIGMDDPWAYRNTVQLVIGRDRNNETTIGFYAPFASNIVSPDACLIVHPRIAAAMHVIEAVIKKHKPIPYDRHTHAGWVRHIIIRTSTSTDQLMIMIVVTSKPPKRVAWIEDLHARMSGAVTIALNVHDARSTTHSGAHTEILYGQPTFAEHIHGIQFSVSPRSFLQINTIQAHALIDIVRTCAALQPTHTVCDAYCGIGTFALVLAQCVARVDAIESMPEAIEDARRNALHNGVTNVTFMCGDVAAVLLQLYGDTSAPDVLILDPPRSGCAPRVRDIVMHIKPPRIVYVSCAPATLARDVRVFASSGYVVEDVWPVDMFPQTEHVECVVLMSRKP
ncbi:MAG: 23S rRNA (uracil(1939)-C(5))-methyltransferase RlmD [Paenibacillaceae bacterium]|nr:23S rRNA (uracil(1939)-C(5))-methyltransferase RlmD [Paenibacillaceae bacterium]